MATPLEQFIGHKVHNFRTHTRGGNQQEGPGVAVALYYQGRDLYYHWGSVPTRGSGPTAPVSRDMVFEIGSMTKAFTATLAAYESLYGTPTFLTDPVSKYLPVTLPPPTPQRYQLSDVTALNLATHTSGMPDNAPGRAGHELFAGDGPNPPTRKYWTDYSSPCKPGSCWEYSNIGFVTLGFALAGATGATYGELLANNVTGPLGMPYTSASPPPGPPVAEGSLYHMATGERTAQAGTAPDLKSTAAEILTFLKANLGTYPPGNTGQLAAAIALTQQVQTSPGLPTCKDPGRATRFYMGMGWQGKVYDDAPWYYKNGATSAGGFSSYMAFLPSATPSLQVAMAMLTNVCVEKAGDEGEDEDEGDGPAEGDGEGGALYSPDGVCTLTLRHILNNR